MNKSQITINALSAIGQVLIVGIVYFFLYKVVLVQIGVELLGVWSLIIATTSVAAIANFGMSSGIVKFVATYKARDDLEAIDRLIFTSGLFVLFTYSVLAILIYVLGGKILPYFIDSDYVSIALKILPFSLISLVVNALGSIYNSAIDGIQKNYLKSIIVTCGSIVLLGISIYLTPVCGIYGLVYAQIIQSSFVLVLTVYCFWRYSGVPMSLAWKWDKNLFKEIFSYGVKIQAASVLEMTFEPITKFMLSKYGGLTFVGYYEMAARLIIQLRSLIVSANQVMIPVVAESKEKERDNQQDSYKKHFGLVLFMSILWATAIIVGAPWISLIWVGRYEAVFILVVILSTSGTFLNILSTPAYFNFMGVGNLNWILISIVCGFVLNIPLGYFLGAHFGGPGVVVGFNLSLTAQSLIMIGSFHRFNQIDLRYLVSWSDIVLLGIAIVVSYFGFGLFLKYEQDSLTVFHALTSTILIILLMVSVVRHRRFVILKDIFNSVLRRT